jgi:excisionase family DNA binding protein
MFVCQGSTPMQGDGELTLAQAAEVLGVSVDTIRRRVRRGELQARQVPTQHGPAWRVSLGNGATVGSTPMHAPLGDLVAMLRELTERAERNAAAAALWQGRAQVLEAELAQAREQLRALPAPPPDMPQDAPQRESGAVSPEPTPPPAAGRRRPWWRFW